MIERDIKRKLSKKLFIIITHFEIIVAINVQF